MKKNLGRFYLIFLILCSVELFATEYKWSVYSNKSSAYINEAIYLKYVCEFNNRAELYAIDFNPKKSTDEYDLKILSENERIIDNKRINTYEFVVFVKKVGEIVFDFETTMKKTTKDSIENTVLGRDNVENVDFSLKKIRQEEIKINIKETNTTLVGDFNMVVKKDVNSLKSYEPYHMEIIIEGIGNFDDIKPFEVNIEGVKVFSQHPIIDTKLSKDGLIGRWSQKFALVSSESFEVPKIELSYFDISDHGVKGISENSTNIEIIKGYEKKELLDLDEEKTEFSFEYLYYLLTFIAGYLAAQIKFKKAKEKSEKKSKLHQKIMNAKSLEELMVILVLQDRIKYADIISMVESDKSVSLETIKKQAIKI